MVDCQGVAQLPALRARLREVEEGSGDVLKVLESAGFKIYEKGFTTLIVTCGRMGSWGKAMEIFEAMGALGVKPNSYTYGALISVCYSAGKWSKALELFYRMRDEECCVDQLVYKHVLPVCVKLGRYDLVLELYGAMQEARIGLEVQTATAVLEACMQSRRWDVAASMLDEFHGSGSVLNHKLYTQLIGACGEHGDVEEALEFFLMMQEVGVNPTSFTCHTLMQAFESAGLVDMAVALRQEMRKARIFVSHDTYNCLARLYAKVHRWNEMLSVLGEMMQRSVKITSESEKVIKQLWEKQDGLSGVSPEIAHQVKNVLASLNYDSHDWQIKAGRYVTSPSRRRSPPRYVRVS